jgi:hypothetical protein
MKAALLNILKQHFARPGNISNEWYFLEKTIVEFDVAARNSPTYVNRLDGRSWPGFVASLSDDELLDMLDWVSYKGTRDIRELTTDLLETAGSAWTLGERNGESGLVRRMPKGVQSAVEVVLRDASAGAILSEAWSAAYGRTPDPEEAYEKAIKAIEQIAAPIVSPQNGKATLGTIIRDMKSQQNWSLNLPSKKALVITDLVEVLWTGQESRHGGNGYRQPTQSEAETAVTLAVALLQLFVSGSVARRSEK